MRNFNFIRIEFDGYYEFFAGGQKNKTLLINVYYCLVGDTLEAIG